MTLTTRTVADLASQVSSINNTDMTNMLSATAAVIAPYDQSKLKVTVSAVKIDANGTAKVAWSDTLGGTKRAVNSVVTLPSRAQRPEHDADLERGVLQLQADDRLRDHRHAQSLRPDLDAAAAVGRRCTRVAFVGSGMGRLVVALIFSMAKRDVTFLSGTAAIRRL